MAMWSLSVHVMATFDARVTTKPGAGDWTSSLNRPQNHPEHDTDLVHASRVLKEGVWDAGQEAHPLDRGALIGRFVERVLLERVIGRTERSRQHGNSDETSERRFRASGGHRQERQDRIPSEPRRRGRRVRGEPFGNDPGQPYALAGQRALCRLVTQREDRKSTRLNSSHVAISYAVFCLKKK